jgi:hypothetical protein
MKRITIVLLAVFLLTWSACIKEKATANKELNGTWHVNAYVPSVDTTQTITELSTLVSILFGEATVQVVISEKGLQLLDSRDSVLDSFSRLAQKRANEWIYSNNDSESVQLSFSETDPAVLVLKIPYGQLQLTKKSQQPK